MVDRLAEPRCSAASRPNAIAALRRGPHDTRHAIEPARGYGLERLDQLVTELLLGAR